MAQGGGPPRLSMDNLDRAVVARLIEDPPADYPQPPFQYLLGCYARSSQEHRSLPTASPKSQATVQRVQDALIACKDLMVSYAGE